MHAPYLASKYSKHHLRKSASADLEQFKAVSYRSHLMEAVQPAIDWSEPCPVTLLTSHTLSTGRVVTARTPASRPMPPPCVTLAAGDEHGTPAPSLTA